jgi:hypothetical protein
MEEDIIMFFQNFMKKHKDDPYDKEKKLKFFGYEGGTCFPCVRDWMIVVTVWENGGVI